MTEDLRIANECTTRFALVDSRREKGGEITTNLRSLDAAEEDVRPLELESCMTHLSAHTDNARFRHPKRCKQTETRQVWTCAS
jgi:hypothetical protein